MKTLHYNYKNLFLFVFYFIAEIFDGLNCIL